MHNFVHRKVTMELNNTNEYNELNNGKGDFFFTINGRVQGGKFAPETKHFERTLENGKPFKSTLTVLHIETLAPAKGSQYPKRQKVQAWGKIAQLLEGQDLVGCEVSCSGTFAQRTFQKQDGSKGYETQFTVEAIDIGEQIKGFDEQGSGGAHEKQSREQQGQEW